MELLSSCAKAWRLHAFVRGFVRTLPGGVTMSGWREAISAASMLVSSVDAADAEAFASAEKPRVARRCGGFRDGVAGARTAWGAAHAGGGLEFA